MFTLTCEPVNSRNAKLNPKPETYSICDRKL